MLQEKCPDPGDLYPHKIKYVYYIRSKFACCSQMTLDSTTPDVGRRLKPQEMDLTEVHSPNCPIGHMSVRQRRRAVEASTPQIPSEMNKAVEAVRFVSAHLKNEDDFGEVNDGVQLSS